MFMLAFTRANNLVRAELIQIGLISKLPWSGSRTFQLHSSDNVNDSSLLCVTSYADDLVLGTIIYDNATAINAAKIIFAIIHRHYTTFAFKLNLKPGKSTMGHVLLARPQEA